MTPRFLRVGPHGLDGRPALEVELSDGKLVVVYLDHAHGRSVASRILECIDGRIGVRPPSRRVLVIEFDVEPEAVPA